MTVMATWYYGVFRGGKNDSKIIIDKDLAAAFEEAAGIDRVSVHGHPTKQVPPDTTVEPGASDAPFVFQTLIVDPNLAYAEFQYPAEGLIGDAFMKREADQRKLLSVTGGEC